MFARVLWIGLLLCISGQMRADDFEQGTELLSSSDYQDIRQAITLIAQSGDPQAEFVLQSLLDGSIYRNRTANNRLVTITGEQDKKTLVTPFLSTGEDIQAVTKRKLKRVAINNRLRGQLKATLAAMQVASTEQNSRYQAIQQLIGNLDADLYQLLKDRLAIEQSDKIKSLIEVALAAYELGQATAPVQAKQAIATLSDSLQNEARNALQAFADSTDEQQLQQAAQQGLARIANKAVWASRIETLFFGLSLGSVLVLAAIGLAITFGVMGVINMAHGELIMLGAYTTYVIQLLMPNNIGLSLILAIPCAFLVSALVGIAIERGVIRFLYGRPLETLLATFGMSLILQQTVRSIFSPLNRSVATPEWMSGAIALNPLLSLTLNRLYIIGFCLLVFAALYLLLRYSRLGLEVRAVSQNRAMAKAMGVRTEWVDAMTFGLGSGIAGIAGVALSQLTNVGPNLGQSYIIDSFMVVVFGGVGNLWGTLVAGLSLGVANKVMEPWAGAVLAKILLLVFIILFIQKRPKGLFPQKGRSAEG